MIDIEAKEVLRWFSDTIMAAARSDSALGSYTEVVWRSGREACFGFLQTRENWKQ